MAPKALALSKIAKGRKKMGNTLGLVPTLFVSSLHENGKSANPMKT